MKNSVKIMDNDIAGVHKSRRPSEAVGSRPFAGWYEAFSQEPSVLPTRCAKKPDSRAPGPYSDGLGEPSDGLGLGPLICIQIYHPPGRVKSRDLVSMSRF